MSEVTSPEPLRLVPDDLLPAARLIDRADKYDGVNIFTQGRGPLCFGDARYQADNLRRRARDHANLAAAYEDLAAWMSGRVGEDQP